MTPARTPILLYDGDCGVCTRLSRFTARRVRRRAGDFTVSTYQDADLAPLGLTPEECDAALQWVGSDGHISSAQNAVARTLIAGRLPWRPVGGIIHVPGINALAGLVYHQISVNRHRLPGGTPACSLPAAERPR